MGDKFVQYGLGIQKGCESAKSLNNDTPPAPKLVSHTQ
jgi:hypothetical protein